MRYQPFFLSRSQQLYSTPQKTMNTSWNREGSICPSTPPTLTANLQVEYLQAQNAQLVSRMKFLQAEVLKQRSRHQQCGETRYCRCSEKYQSQIKVLENYLKNSQSLNRETILYIFGKQNGFNSKLQIQEQTPQINLIKQLNLKVQKLIQENRALKQHHKGTLFEQNQIIKQENQKYRCMIKEFEKVEEELQSKLMQENRFFREKNIDYELQIIRLTSELSQAHDKLSKLPQISQKAEKSMEGIQKIMEKEIKAFYESLDLRTECLHQCLDQFQQRVSKIQDSLIQKSSRKIETMRKNPSGVPIARNQSKESYDSDDTVKDKQANGSSLHQSEPQQSKMEQIELDPIENKDNLVELKKLNDQLLSENHLLTLALKQKTDYLNSKIEKILTLENQLNFLKNNSQISERSQPNQSKYAGEVENIRQTLLSCNPVNFEMFQTEFRQIVQQRNTLGDKMMNFKKALHKNNGRLSQNKKDNQQELNQVLKKMSFLQQKINQLSKENQSLKEKLEAAQKQIDTLRNTSFTFSQQILDSMEDITNVKEPEGFAGLQWQLVVQRCILDSAEKLRVLSEKMKVKN